MQGRRVRFARGEKKKNFGCWGKKGKLGGAEEKMERKGKKGENGYKNDLKTAIKTSLRVKTRDEDPEFFVGSGSGSGSDLNS